MRSSFVLPEIVLERSAAMSLRDQIRKQILLAARQGKLSNGSRLPSSRLLSKLLGISRSTVVDAYEDLLEHGLLKAIAGSGVYVSDARRTGISDGANLRRVAAEAHCPIRTLAFDDPSGNGLYLNVIAQRRP